MVFSLPSVKELIAHLRIDAPLDKSGLVEKNGSFYSRSAADAVAVPCPVVREDDPFVTLLAAFRSDSVAAVLDENGQALGCITAAQIIDVLHNAYHQLHAFYEAVLQTTDSSITVIDDHKRVCSWTDGAEKIFSFNYHEIIGQPITHFFDPQKLVILKSLEEGKRIVGQHHQPRSDLFVLINSTPVYFQNEIIGAVVSETDITSQVVLNEKLFNMSNEMHRLEQEVAKYKDSSDPFRLIKGKSAALQETVQLARKVCTVKSTVLILGESGVGKEVFAKTIHEASEGPGAPFISINCGAIPASLFESELFGYERGAFSGADNKGKKGKIELARGGTLFLDEVGEMPLEMQVKLLRVLQERKYYRVGGEKEIDIDFRLIAATNRDLPELMREGKFREDLYYRLNVVSLHIPPLRERKEDIIELTHYFLHDFSLNYQRPVHEISPDVIHELLCYEWPGNIRELRNVVERLIVFATDGVIKREYLPFHADRISLQQVAENQTLHPLDTNTTILPLQDEMDQHEKKVLERALQLVDGNKLECAKQLGITRATLYNRLKRLGLS